MHMVNQATLPNATPIKLRPGAKGVLWMAIGAVPFLIFILVVPHFRPGTDTASQLASKAERVDVVGQMQLDLATASEAEKSAVLSITDHDSQTFADQARAASAKVNEERQEVEGLLTAGGTPGERDLLAQFTTAFGELQRVDDELLALAVQNTNIKAYNMAFGPAAALLGEMNTALTRLIAAKSNSLDAKRVMPLAFGAQISALRILALLPPHIAEESDERMDQLEAQMATEDSQVRADLRALAALPSVSKDPELAKATARYAELTTTRKEILKLSRENTNVRSLGLSLNQKRKVMLACQSALSALQQAILAEPIAGTTYGSPPRPR